MEKTEYKVVSSEKEYRDCLGLMDNKDDLSYPTILAVRDKEPIGMISTARGDEHVFISYLKANSIFTCIRLYEMYEKVLSDAGVSHYLFNIEKENIKMINAVEKLFNIKPFGETDRVLFYVRRI